MANLRRVVMGSVVVAVAALGCGQGSKVKTVPVSGKVTFKNAALEGATVTFVQEYTAGVVSYPAVGTTDAQGMYKLSTLEPPAKSVLGAVPGKYFVTITKTDNSGGVAAMVANMNKDDISKMSDEDKRKMGSQAHGAQRNTGSGATDAAADTVAKYEIPARYADPKGSKLEADVKASGAQTFDFTVEEN